MTYFETGPASDSEQPLQAAEARDFFALLKPRVMSLVVFTGLVGMAVAPLPIHPVMAFTALLCIAVGAGASGALNMWYDADIDAVMRRTRSRPVPAGRIAAGEALAFGLTLAVGSVAVMGLLVGPLPAALLAFTIFFYAVVYTMWLKRSTPENIVIGGAAGALPPVIGWAAATGAVGIEPLVLFAIIFLWTPPHFWALALLQSADYERAGVPMLPVVAGDRTTRRRILWYSLVLAPLGVVPAFIGLGTVAYGVIAAALGLVFVWLAVKVLGAAEGDRRPAAQLFAFSILYLFLLFAVLLGEHAAAGLGLLA